MTDTTPAAILRTVTIEFDAEGRPSFVKASIRDSADREIARPMIAGSALDAPCAADPSETWGGVLGWLGDMISAEGDGYRRGTPKPKPRGLRAAWDALRGK